jgi:hypothetical protein
LDQLDTIETGIARQWSCYVEAPALPDAAIDRLARDTEAVLRWLEHIAKSSRSEGCLPPGTIRVMQP